MNKTLSKTAEFLGLKRNVVLMLTLTVIMYTGEKLWERFIPKYLDEVGTSVLIIGGFGFLQNFLGAVWALPGGYLADLLGSRKAFLLFNILAVFGYAIAIVFESWLAVFVGMLFFFGWSNVALPGSMSLITKTLGRDKTVMGISMHSIIRRFPMIAGPLAGGWLIMNYGLVLGIKIAFGISIIFSIAGMFFINKLTDDSQKEKPEKLHPVVLWRSFDKKLKNLLISDILIRFCEQIPYVFVVIWCMNVVKVTAGDFGILTAIEMLTSALIYIPVASFSDRLEKKPFVVITFLFFTVFPVMLYFSGSFGLLAIAFIIRGLKEFGEPTRKALILELSVKNAEARSFGLYYFIRDGIVAFAGFLGGALWLVSPELNLFTAFGFGVLGTLMFALFGKGTEKVVERLR
ncbi:MAG: MFS transporter [Chlorobi bacterium]|nr:MFS transporter [Chlorobiota bacterium]MCI0716956.1 MFS transporter [Chlorobiota bacterium]